MVKLAIPVSNDVLSKIFGQCHHYEIIEIDNDNCTTKRQEIPPKDDAASLLQWIKNEGITDVIAHHIDGSFVNYFADTKINLFIGIHISSPDELVDEYLNGTLQSNANNLNKIS